MGQPCTAARRPSPYREEDVCGEIVSRKGKGHIVEDEKYLRLLNDEITNCITVVIKKTKAAIAGSDDWDSWTHRLDLCKNLGI